MSRVLRLCLLPALLAAHGAWAQVQPSLQDERARIAVERARIAERLAVEEQACHQRFAVNDCLERSRALQREALDGLQRQEVMLNDGERRRKAAEQLERLDEKRKERASDQATRPAGPARMLKPAPVPDGGKLPGEASPRLTDPGQAEQHQETMRRKQQRHADGNARRADQAAKAEEAQSRQERRLRDAAEHKARLLERNAGNPSTAKPLPPP